MVEPLQGLAAANLHSRRDRARILAAAEIGQDLQSGLPYCGVQSQARFSRLPKSRDETCEARPRRLLAPQIQSDVRYAMSVGGSRSAHGSAVARTFRYGIDYAVFEAVAEPVPRFGILMT